MIFESIEVYNELTENEKKVFRFFVDNYKDIPLMNISEVAKSNYISNTVVINLAHKLGYSGFKELKFAIYNDLREKKITRLDRHDIKEYYKESINKTFDLINDDAIASCAKVMTSSNNIFIMARGTSIAAGYYMQHLLFSINHHCIFISDYNLAEAFVNLAKDGDCIIFISLSGMTQKIVDTARMFQVKGCELVTLTGFHSNTLANMTKYNLYSYTDQIPKQHENRDAHSRLGFFLVIEILIKTFKMKKEIEN